MSAERTLGGKAASWMRLSKNGIPVPDGFAIAADKALDLAHIEQELGDLLARTGPTTVIVRSSGVGEDGSQMALAGLFESFLDVPAQSPDVLESVRRCRSLGRSARALSATGGPVSMGVLIQEMIHPTCSGVLFTRDPFGQETGMVVEAVNGHLANLVDGRQDPTRWRLGRDATPQEFQMLETTRLEQIGQAVEAILGGPADIEWAIADSRVVVLQARPITSLPSSAGPRLELVPVNPTNASQFPPAVLQHDKIALRLIATELGIGISQGLVALASSPRSEDLEHAAEALVDWGEFIAVLLWPFYLEGAIFRKICSGRNALTDLTDFVDRVGAQHDRFAFLLKELQPTASTGVAVRLPDGSVRVELVHGHFITKGFADPTAYILDRAGAVETHAPGKQKLAMQVVDGQTVRVPVDGPVLATAVQLETIRHAAMGLADHYPGAGMEFGFTPEDEFFLVDLYQSDGTTPPVRSDVMSHGRVLGRIRVLDLSDEAIEESIERHVHSPISGGSSTTEEAEILVVERPLHVLDRLIYDAGPGSLGFICEGGAMLCHLAVVMREHGVPGLILPDARSTFSDGERVVLDTRPGSTAFITRG